MKVHNIKYENGGFYLTINNLRGYFNFNNNHGILTMLFDDINKQHKYYQVWKDIKILVLIEDRANQNYTKKLGYMILIYL